MLIYSEEYGLYYNTELTAWVNKDKATKFDRKEDAAKYRGKLRNKNGIINFRIVPLSHPN